MVSPAYGPRRGSISARSIVLLVAGAVALTATVSLASGMNSGITPQHTTPVRLPPEFAVLATGDELVMPVSTPGPGIRHSNGYALRALGARRGRLYVDLGIAPTRSQPPRRHPRSRDAGADIKK